MARRSARSIQAIPSGERKCTTNSSHGHRLDEFEVAGYEPTIGIYPKKLIFKESANSLKQALEIKNEYIKGYNLINYKNKPKNKVEISITGFKYDKDGSYKEYKLQSDGTWVPLLN